MVAVQAKKFMWHVVIGATGFFENECKHNSPAVPWLVASGDIRCSCFHANAYVSDLAMRTNLLSNNDAFSGNIIHQSRSRFVARSLTCVGNRVNFQKVRPNQLRA